MCCVNVGQTEKTKKLLFSLEPSREKCTLFYFLLLRFVLMSALTLSNAKPVESHFNSKIVLNPLSTDDKKEVITSLTSRQP